MKLPHECKNIEEVRREIDKIDNEILSLIGKRLGFVKEIIKFKNNTDDVYATDRYNAVIEERREVPSDNLGPDVIERIYQIMMDYFIREQLDLLK